MTYSRSKGFGMTLFIVLLLTPIYWLLNMSFKTNQEIIKLPFVRIMMQLYF